MKPLTMVLVLAAVLTLPPLRSAAAAAAAAPPVGEGNAALQYYQAFAMMFDGLDKSIDEWNTVSVEGEILAMLSDTNPRLGYLHAGARMDRCDWGIDFTPGPATLMPHLNEAHRLARLALLRARYRFEQARWQPGVEDTLATMELARDVGVTPVLICLLVQYRMDDMAGELTARHLNRFDRATLDLLAGRLDELPARDILRWVWAQESTYFVDWTIARLAEIEKEVGGDRAKWEERVLALPLFLKEDADKLRAMGVPPPDGFRSLLGSVKTFLAEMGPATDLPAAEQDARLAELYKPFEAEPVARQFLIPSQEKIFQTRRRWQARRAMLTAAVGVVREGADALKQERYADPFGKGPFEYRKTGGGFELQSRLTYEGKPVVLVVGSAK
jgi:hypothetical protein